MFNKACKTFGKDKINLITIASLRKYMSDFESKFSDEYCDAMFYALKNVLTMQYMKIIFRYPQ